MQDTRSKILEAVRVLEKKYFDGVSCVFSYGASSSGKTQDFGSCIRRFESSRPSQGKRVEHTF